MSADTGKRYPANTAAQDGNHHPADTAAQDGNHHPADTAAQDGNHLPADTAAGVENGTAAVLDAEEPSDTEHRSRVRDCAALFRADPAYRRIMEKLREKYKSFGRPAGEIILKDADRAECDAVGRIFGELFEPPSLRFKTARFEQALHDSPYSGVSLLEALEAYFGETIQTEKEARSAKQDAFQRVLSAARGQSAVSDAWLEELSFRRGPGYSLLRRAAGKNEGGASAALLRACKGLRCLEQQREPVRLAVLAANAVSDPHAFDSGTLCGSLFLHLLCFRTEAEPPRNSMEESALYDSNGILRDSISSTVSQFGLLLYTGEGEHPAFAAFRKRGEACTLTLANLERLSTAASPSGRAYVVENEMVFAQLCGSALRFRYPLLCTSGQPSVAALRLLDMLDRSGATLYYSGDFDGRGLSITAQLSERYSERFVPWHMAPEDYARCRSGEPLSEKSAALLKGVRAVPETVSVVLQTGFAGYQELLLPLLEADLCAVSQ